MLSLTLEALMKHKPTIKLFVILAAVALISCKGSKDVQKPLVEKPENSFLKQA